MLIKSIKTGLEQTVTKEEYDKLVRMGEAARFKVLSTEDTKEERAAAPEETGDANRQGLIDAAKEAESKEDWANALDLYQKAAAIKSSSNLTKKIKAMTDKVDSATAGDANGSTTS